MDRRSNGELGVRTVTTKMELTESLHRTLWVKAALENRSMNGLVVEALRESLHGFCLEPDLLEVETIDAPHQRGDSVPKEVTQHD